MCALDTKGIIRKQCPNTCRVCDLPVVQGDLFHCVDQVERQGNDFSSTQSVMIVIKIKNEFARNLTLLQLPITWRTMLFISCGVTMQANLWLVSSSSIRGFHMSRSKPRLLIMEWPVYSTLCLGQLSTFMPLLLMISQRCKYFFTEHNCQKSDFYDAISCNIAKINVHSKKINYSCSSNFPNKTCINPILRLFILTSVKLEIGSLRK